MTSSVGFGLSLLVKMMILRLQRFASSRCLRVENLGRVLPLQCTHSVRCSWQEYLALQIKLSPGVGSDSEVLFVTSGTTDLGEGIISCKRSTNTSLKLISTPLDVPRCTNIICTMGPKCWDEDMMGKLLDAGMDVIRLNFSHGSHEAHQEVCGMLLDKPRSLHSLDLCLYHGSLFMTNM